MRRRTICFLLASLLVLLMLPMGVISIAADGNTPPEPDSITLTEAQWQAARQAMVKRVRQLMEIEWTCRRNMSGVGNPVLPYYSNTVYHGVPHVGGSIQTKVPFSKSLSRFKQDAQNSSNDLYGGSNFKYGIDASSYICYAWG